MIAAIGLGVLQVVVVVSLALAGPDDATHRAPIGISAPPVVASTVLKIIDAEPGRPVVARAIATAAAARASVQDGSVVAAVVVDLSSETDILYIASARGTWLNSAVERQVSAIEGPLGRRVEVRDLVPARAGDAGARGVFAIVGVLVILAFAVPIVVTWLRGPVAPTFGLGVLRLAVVSGSSGALGLVAAMVAAGRYGGDVPGWWLIGTLTVLAGATTTMALQSLFGVVGIGIASTVFVLAAAPLVRVSSPLLLPEPWAFITPWLPHGAALDAGINQAYFGGGNLLPPMLVLLAWTALSVLTMVVSRRERTRDHIESPTLALG